MKIKLNSWLAKQHEQKKSAAAAANSVSRREMFTWFLIFFSFYTMCREWDTLPSLHIMWSPGVLIDMANADQEIVRNRKISGTVNSTSASMLDESNNARTLQPNNKIRCSKGEASDICDMVGDIRIDPDATTVYYVIPPKTDAILIAGDDTDNTTTTTSSSWTIKPYARTDDASAMALVSEWSVKMVSPAGNDHQHLPNCTQVHDPPGVFFSLGGYSGNHYHGFADVLIPLFVTSRPFDRQVELLVIDSQPWMVSKVKKIMQALSRYDEVDIDRSSKQDGKILCFSRLVMGLKGRGKKELGISPLETDYTMKDFRQFLRSAYSLSKTTAIKLRTDDDDEGDKKNLMMNNPQLLIISRKGSRAFTNVNEIAGMATKLGYDVKVVEPDDKTMSQSAEMMNSCDVVVGVHGAGLTNMVFLPDNAVVVQVIPLALDWSAKIYYEEPTKEMNLRYLQYKIKKEESSLMGRYPPDHVVFTTPWSIKWEEFRSIYMQNQNVTVDLRRFRPTLVKALELLHD